MPHFIIDGQPLHYTDQGTGEVILLAHSYLWDQHMWAPQVQALQDHYRVIVPELWGHGASGPLPASTRSLTDLARQVMALLDHLAIERCNLVGLSVGGMWGAKLAMDAPERIDRLVLMDTYVGAEDEPKRQYYFSLLRQLEDEGGMSPALLDIVVPMYFHPDADLQSPLCRAFRAALAAMPAEVARQSIAPLGRIIFGREDLRDRLHELDPRKTLVMCGDRDIPRPPHETVEMARLIGCAQVLVPDAGHISNLENPGFVTDTLLSFLASR